MKFISNKEVELTLTYLQSGNMDELYKIKPKGDKPKYDVILNHIKKLDADARDSISISGEKYLSNNEDSIDHNISQIINYILLEIPRANEFDKFKEQAENSQSQLRSLRRQIIDERKKIEQHEEKVEKIKSEFISILSIFAAMFIAFFGGVQILGSIMSAVENSNFYVLSMISILVGLILFNIIYMLLYTIGKIIDRGIGINIAKNKCENCSKQNLLSCLISKYPLPFFYNVFCVSMFIIIWVLYILDKYKVLKYFSTSFVWLLKNNKYLNISIILLALILISILSIKLILNRINIVHKSFSCTSKNLCNSNLTTYNDQNNPVTAE